MTFVTVIASFLVAVLVFTPGQTDVRQNRFGKSLLERHYLVLNVIDMFCLYSDISKIVSFRKIYRILKGL